MLYLWHEWKNKRDNLKNIEVERKSANQRIWDSVSAGAVWSADWGHDQLSSTTAHLCPAHGGKRYVGDEFSQIDGTRAAQHYPAVYQWG